MRLVKRILANDAVRGFLCWLGSLYIRLVFATGRWTVVGGDIPQRLWDAGRPFILCFWHGRLLMMPYCWDRTRPIHMLISEHRDGRIIARTVSHFGIDTVVGSKGRGGAAALRAMLGLLKAGDCVGITPDGPRGPRMRVSDGIVTVARLSGAPIVAASFGVSRRRLLSSWDRFLVALPLARGVVVWGQPIEVPRDADPKALETARAEVERTLNAITADADARFGQPRVEAAP